MEDGLDAVAGRAQVLGSSVENLVASNSANVDGTLNLLQAARGAGLSRVLYAGSSSCYGDQPTLPKHEDRLPVPKSVYAVSKLACEHYMRKVGVKGSH